jgi:hypothetical protein
MRRSLNTAAAAGLALAVSVLSANAVTVSIGLQEGGPITPVGTTGTSAGFAGAFGTFIFNQVSGHGNPDVAFPDLLLSNSINTSTDGPGTINVFVTAQGITSPAGLVSFLSSFTTNIVPAGWTVVEQTYLDPGNGQFTNNPALQLAGPVTLGSLGSAAQNSTKNAGNNYSITEEFSITALGPGSANSTIDVAVPGPLAGAGVPGLIAACAGLLGLARRRQRKNMA